MTAQIEFQYSAVAFLDVLGWKDAIQKSVSDPTLRQRMADALYGGQTQIFFPGGSPTYDRGFRVATQFSDSIVISRSMASAAGPELDDVFYEAIEHFVIHMLQYGFFVRGAVAYGEMFHQGYVAFGPALVDAIEAEKRAIYPRIVEVDVGSGPRLRRATDGICFVDVLKNVSPQVSDHARFYSGIRRTIEERLHQFSGNAALYLKYEWFARYFNDVAKELGVQSIAGL